MWGSFFFFFFFFLVSFFPLFWLRPQQTLRAETPPLVLFDEDGDGLTSLASCIMFSISLSCVGLLSELRLWDGGRGGRRASSVVVVFSPHSFFFPSWTLSGFYGSELGIKQVGFPNLIPTLSSCHHHQPASPAIHSFSNSTFHSPAAFPCQRPVPSTYTRFLFSNI